jgi:hypothetical protein
MARAEIVKPLDTKKLASYLNETRVFMCSEKEHLLLMNSFALFRIPLKYAGKPLSIYIQPEKDVEYEKEASGFVSVCSGEHGMRSGTAVRKQWQKFVDWQNHRVILPTNLLLQDSDLFQRRFTGTGNVVWLDKRFTDILKYTAEDLSVYYRFEELYDPKDTSYIMPVRVMFNSSYLACDDKWQAIAIIMPCDIKDKALAGYKAGLAVKG